VKCLDKVSESWLNSLSESTRDVYKFYWEKFVEFTKMNGKQILQQRKREENGEWKTKIFKFRKYLIEHEGLSQNSAKTGVGAVRGFFSHYDQRIRFTRGEKQRLKRSSRKRRDYTFSKNDLRKIAMVSNLKEKYIVLVGKSFGLRSIDFIRLTYGTYRAIDLTQDAPIGLGEIDTIKEGVSSNPFLDSDSIPVIKQILDSNQDKPDNERVLTIRKTELTTNLQRLSERANIETGDQHVRFHGLRKYLIDRLSAYCSESQWKQICGKKISESEYVSTEQLKGIYARAMNDIICLPLNNNTGVIKETVEKLEIENDGLRHSISLLQQRINKLENKHDPVNTILDIMASDDKAKWREMHKLAKRLQKFS
jgi:integrase